MNGKRQSALRAELEAGQRAVDEKVEALAASLRPDQVDWTPPEGGWGIGQVFEHLAVSAESYVEPFERLLARGTPAAEGDPEWRPALLGGWLANALEKEGNRLPAPKAFKVGPAARPDVIRAFLDVERQLAGLRTRLAGLDWRRTRIISPVSVLVRYNLGDALRILVVHAARHLRQVARIQVHPGFPR